jgi:hypothetical protein
MSIQDQTANENIIKYLEKSYIMIQRLTETNKIITIKNKELFTKNIIFQDKIKLLEEEIRMIKEKNKSMKYINSEVQNQDDFEII